MKPEYVSRDSGFIALYTKDKNRPSLYMHIFLMYEFNKGISLYNTFKGFKTFYGSNCIFIDNVCYYLFTFVMNNECKNLIKGLFPHETKSLLRLLSFWNSDQEIANKIISNEGTFKFEESEVPEEDYRRGGYDDIQEYIGLRIQKGLTPE